MPLEVLLRIIFCNNNLNALTKQWTNTVIYNKTIFMAVVVAQAVEQWHSVWASRV